MDLKGTGTVVTKKFDLVVIGSGPAGEKGAAQAAYFGKSVALIEKENVLGGAAANTGTLPSKTLRESALYLSGFRQRGLYGITFQLKDKVTARDFLYRERLVVQSEHSRISDNIKGHNIELYRGFAKFEDDHTILVTPSNGKPVSLQGDVILIATGSNPFQPANFPFSDPRVYDSDTILHINQIPSSMLIAGGGVMNEYLLKLVRQILYKKITGYSSIKTSDYLVMPGLGSLAGVLGAIALARNS